MFASKNSRPILTHQAHSIFSPSVQKPLSEIKDGVPAERVKGAAIAATALTLLASKGVVASSAVGLSAAYVSVSKGVAGDFARTVGGITWDATETASKLADQLGIIPKFGEVDKTVVNKYDQKKPLMVGSDVDEEGELASIEAEYDDDLARVLKEAESVISEADAAIAKAEADQKEKVKQAIEEELRKITENAKMQEEERIAKEAKLMAENEVKSSTTKLDTGGILAKEDSGDIVFEALGSAAMEAIKEFQHDIEKADEEKDSGDVDFQALGSAAREAVEAFELDIEKADEEKYSGDADLRALGSAAREAVEAFERDAFRVRE